MVQLPPTLGNLWNISLHTFLLIALGDGGENPKATFNNTKRSAISRDDRPKTSHDHAKAAKPAETSPKQSITTQTQEDQPRHAPGAKNERSETGRD